MTKQNTKHDTLREINTADKFTGSIDVDAENKTATVSYTVRGNKDAKKAYVVESVFDYSGVSVEDLLRTCAAKHIIQRQQVFRTMFNTNNAESRAKAIDGKTWKRVDVQADIISKERKPADPMDKLVQSTMAAFGVDEAGAKDLISTMAKGAEQKKAA